MVRVDRDKAFREEIPDFLLGLDPSSLFDLSWTNPEQGVQDKSWWPEVNEDFDQPALFFKFGDEILTIDLERKVVVVTHQIVPLTPNERADLEAQIYRQMKFTVWDHMDSVVQGRGYSSILELCTYGQSSNSRFADEARSGIGWRDQCKVKLDQLSQQVNSGEIQLIAGDGLIAQMPAFAWPE